MPRREKTVASQVSIPRDLDEAVAFVAAIGAERREVTRLEAELNDRLVAIREEAEGAADPHRRRLEELFEGVRIWAEAHRRELCADGSKTRWLPTGTICWRTTPPKVQLRDVTRVLKMLQELGLDEFIRVRAEVDKEAILSKPAVADRVPGITITQREEFIVEPAEDAISVPSTRARAAEVAR